MSDPVEKNRNSTRRHRDEVAIKKQVRIAKEHNMHLNNPNVEKQSHRYNKHHSMNCGNSGCMLCSNPRKIWNEATIQEQRFYQDVDTVRDKNSNGLEREE